MRSVAPWLAAFGALVGTLALAGAIMPTKAANVNAVVANVKVDPVPAMASVPDALPAHAAMAAARRAVAGGFAEGAGRAAGAAPTAAALARRVLARGRHHGDAGDVDDALALRLDGRDALPAPDLGGGTSAFDAVSPGAPPPDARCCVGPACPPPATRGTIY